MLSPKVFSARFPRGASASRIEEWVEAVITEPSGAQTRIRALNELGFDAAEGGAGLVSPADHGTWRIVAAECPI